MLSSLILLSDPVIFSVRVSHLIYLLIAIIIGLLAETLIGWRLPYGILGATLCALIGIALLVVLPFHLGAEINLFGLQIAIVKAFIGGAVLITIWHLVTYSRWRRRHRFYGGYRDREDEYNDDRDRRRDD